MLNNIQVCLSEKNATNCRGQKLKLYKFAFKKKKGGGGGKFCKDCFSGNTNCYSRLGVIASFESKIKYFSWINTVVQNNAVGL